MHTKTLKLKAGITKSSVLDRDYNNHINNVITSLNDDDEMRWETYGVIIEELINNGKQELFKEIKYRLTDGENPNEVFLSVFEKDLGNIDGVIWFLKKRIEEYIEEDSFKRFYI